MKMKRIRFGILCGSIATAIAVSPAMAATPTAGSAKAESDKPTVERWSDRIFDEFREMEQRVEEIFHDATRSLKEHTDWFGGSEFSSSVKFSEEADNYIVRLSLPDRDLGKVDVTVSDKNTLRITANAEQKETAATGLKTGEKKVTEYELSRYEQLLTLPGPVDAAKMAIDRSGNMLTITLPKAE